MEFAFGIASAVQGGLPFYQTFFQSIFRRGGRCCSLWEFHFGALLFGVFSFFGFSFLGGGKGQHRFLFLEGNLA